MRLLIDCVDELRMKLPKACIAQEGNGTEWGAVRLHVPVIVAELEMIHLEDDKVNCRPWVWPPDLLASITDHQAEGLVADLWIMFERRHELEFEDVEVLRLDLARVLPRFLVLDNDEEDFTGVLDTEAGLLWSVDEQLILLNLVENWQMHPGMRPDLDMVRCREELKKFWKRFLVESGIYAEEDDLRGWAE